MSGYFSRTKDDMKYLFSDNKKLGPKKRQKKRRAKAVVLGIVLVIIQLVITLLFMAEFIHMDMLPMKYLIMLNVVLILIFLYDFMAQFTSSHMVGKVLALLMSGVLLFGYLASSKLTSTLELITGGTKIDVVNVVVLKQDSANSIKDTLKYSYGYNSMVDEGVVTKAIYDLNQEYSSNLTVNSYTDWDDLIDDLYKNVSVHAVMIKEDTYKSIQREYTDFSDKTKIVGTIEIKSQIKLSDSDKKVNEESFIIYLSGLDNEGEVSLYGHSDVNIFAVCNPKTRQILLVSTPRDAFVYMTNAAGRKGLDKLTHASNSGIEYAITALKNIYGIEPDFYVRVNFTGVVNIVDALGGITINSSVDFVNGTNAWYEQYHFNVGPNECDGQQTIAFVRERLAFSDGDFQRGKNQEAALEAIIQKATSPAILTRYSTILDAVSDMMITNMPTSTISALVKGQISNGASWNIQSYSVEGKTDTADGEVWDIDGMDIVRLSDSSIQTAIELMNKIYDGDVFDVEEYITSK